MNYIKISYNAFKILNNIEILRFVQTTPENLNECTIHTFIDASKDVYTAVIFLRFEKENEVKLNLLIATS